MKREELNLADFTRIDGQKMLTVMGFDYDGDHVWSKWVCLDPKCSCMGSWTKGDESKVVTRVFYKDLTTAS